MVMFKKWSFDSVCKIVPVSEALIESFFFMFSGSLLDANHWATALKASSNWSMGRSFAIKIV